MSWVVWYYAKHETAERLSLNEYEDNNQNFPKCTPKSYTSGILFQILHSLIDT